jgi:hypothetical protein
MQFPANTYNPMLNAQQRLMQMQMEQQYPQYQTTQGTTFLNGRMVDTYETVKANDVPMDGMGAIFIKSDGSEIQHRVWGNDGLIKIKRYLPQNEDFDLKTGISSTEEEKTKIDHLDALREGIQNNFMELSDKLDRIEKSLGGKSSNNKPKKEVEQNV